MRKRQDSCIAATQGTVVVGHSKSLLRLELILVQTLYVTVPLLQTARQNYQDGLGLYRIEARRLKQTDSRPGPWSFT